MRRACSLPTRLAGALRKRDIQMLGGSGRECPYLVLPESHTEDMSTGPILRTEEIDGVWLFWELSTGS